MEVDMRKVSRMALCITLTALTITGCGGANVPDMIDKPMISVAQSGEVTEYLVGEFGAERYNISELSSMAAEEAAIYNTANQTGSTTPVKLEKVEALEDGSGRVGIVYQYDSAESYTGFNEGSLFYGTVGEAIAQEYAVNIDLVSAGGKDGGIFTSDQLKQAVDRRLIIAPYGVYIYCPGKVEYISDNAVMAEDGSVNATAAEEPVYILLK